jgi:hypothetical protein
VAGVADVRGFAKVNDFFGDVFGVVGDSFEDLGHDQ